MDSEKKELLKTELIFKATKSSGPGGQNVNKVSTKIELRFNVQISKFLTDKEKYKIYKKHKNIINKEGYLILTEQNSRSQLSNKTTVTRRFFLLISTAVKPTKKRIATKPSKQSIAKRLKDKQLLSQKKQNRRWNKE